MIADFGVVTLVPGKVIQEAEERHNCITRLYVLQGARHLPFGGRPAQKLTKMTLSFPFKGSRCIHQYQHITTRI